MKRSILAAAAVLAVSLPAAGARAATLWDNGGPQSDAGYCSASGQSCTSTGWTLYDDFQLTQAATITGLTYASNFFIWDSTPASYESTNWSIWSADPRTNFAAGPLASGTSVGANVTGASGFTTTTLSNLKVALASGTYWLGLQNNTFGSSISTYVTSATPRLGQASLGADGGTYFIPELTDAAFTLQGHTGVSAVPEPATWAMLITGFGLAGSVLRSRRRQVLA